VSSSKRGRALKVAYETLEKVTITKGEAHFEGLLEACLKLVKDYTRLLRCRHVRPPTLNKHLPMFHKIWDTGPLNLLTA
jgi:hypothetical protein